MRMRDSLAMNLYERIFNHIVAQINTTLDVGSHVSSISVLDIFGFETFDVNSLDTTVSGGDYMDGGPLADQMFGQGNGVQPASQRDPLDGGVDNDGDFDLEGADEDQPWDGDMMFGRGGDDYMEGNHGSDLMYGGPMRTT